MSDEAKKSLLKHSSEVASSFYSGQTNSERSSADKGLAETHELFSDSYMAGTVEFHHEETRKQN
jgi:hypothetical protein